MNKKALVLSSGGVDSTTCVSVAVEGFGKENVSTVSIFYGQKHRKELGCAQKVAEYYGLPHYELDLSKLFQYSNCSLLAHSTEEIVHKSYEQQIAENGEGKVSTYVPFRNGLMLSAVASLAMSIYEKDDVSIFIGAHADDAAGNAYADCSEAFLDAMGRAISLGTYSQCHMVADFTHIKDVVMQLDHAFINDIVKTNPTAENIAKWIHDQKSEGNVAIYED